MSGPLNRLVELTGWVGRRSDRYDWDAVRAELGTDLPPDYIELVDTFGAGWFDDAVGLLEPGCEVPSFSLTNVIRERCSALKYFLKVLDGIVIPEEEIPHSIRGRDPIMAWGVSDFALYFFWRCSPWDQPARWPVALNVLGESWDEYSMTATELLVGAISGSLRLENFEGRLPRRDHKFVPLAEWQV